ncbi:MAG: hypothetical protein ACI39H_02790 [Lachnospiraceae bacterium]
MDFLVWLIIIAGISSIVKQKKKAEENKREDTGRQAAKAATQNRASRQAAKPVAQNRAGRQTAKQPAQYGAERQAAKDPIRETARTYTKEDILSRSTQGVREDFGEDTLKKEADRHEFCVEGHYEQQKELLKTVEDLMVLGPNCTLSYERDFIAEGEKMIESFR